MNTTMETIVIFFLTYFLLSCGEDRSDISRTAWQFIAGNGSNMYLQHRNFLTDAKKRDNIKCTTSTKVSLDISTQSAVYYTYWYNVTANITFKILSAYIMHGENLSATHTYGNNTETDNYTFVYSDGNCAVTLVPNYNQAAEPCNVACEMWIREGCILEENAKCEQAYKKTCGSRIIQIYNETYCDIMNNWSPLLDLTPRNKSSRISTLNDTHVA